MHFPENCGQSREYLAITLATAIPDVRYIIHGHLLTGVIIFLRLKAVSPRLPASFGISFRPQCTQEQVCQMLSEPQAVSVPDLET